MEKYPIIPGSVINPFGERCFLKYIKGGQTECCFFDAPCKDHTEDKKKEILLDNDWRDARKELPDDRRDVIIGNANNKCVSVGWWDSEGKWLIRTAHFDGDVTHWKELPDPPEFALHDK